MKSFEFYLEENQQVKERYELALGRVYEILEEESAKAPFLDYFRKTAAFLLVIHDTWDHLEKGDYEKAELAKLAQWNYRLYEDILGENYKTSYGNPEYAVKMLGGEFGQLLCVLYAELRNLIQAVFDGRLYYMTAYFELFIEIYNLFEDEFVSAKEVRNAMYWFMSDYSEIFLEDLTLQRMNLAPTRVTELVQDMEEDNVRYLYRSGEYVSDNDIKMAEFLNEMPEEEVDTLGYHIVQDLVTAYVNANADIHKKDNIQIRYNAGMERVINRVIRHMKKEGLDGLVLRAPSICTTKNPVSMRGFHGTRANREYDYDHRYDEAIFLDRRLKERKLEVLRNVYEENKEAARKTGGTLWVLAFGEKEVEVRKKPEAPAFTEEQRKIHQEYLLERTQMADEYQPSEEDSFSIVGLPVPEISEDFEEIFKETVRINTLDVKKYEQIQQVIIDALDLGEFVHITGRDGNETDLVVAMAELKDPSKETLFGNCLADCNVPLGEVYTSPKLAGSNGLLHVKRFFFDGLDFKNLKLWFKDGMVERYSCENFDNEEENLSFIKENIMAQHDTVPLGEFAVGTNTAAYAMGRKYGIEEKLPILITEKTGPHFAVGDTCYSQAEDHPVYNPDGKEVVARDNEISLLRKTDVSKAYYSCHVDITIPYDELGDIVIWQKEEKVSLIEGGRFVLPGTECLNEDLGE